jgi:hypothetical protein
MNPEDRSLAEREGWIWTAAIVGRAYGTQTLGGFRLKSMIEVLPQDDAVRKNGAAYIH